MEIILLEHVEKLGKMGDKVHVKSGYARNYLLPQNKALRATEANVAYLKSSVRNWKPATRLCLKKRPRKPKN